MRRLYRPAGIHVVELRPVVGLLEGNVIPFLLVGIEESFHVFPEISYRSCYECGYVYVGINILVR